MSTDRDWQTLRERIAGKWQFPLLALSVIVLGTAVYRFRSPPTRLPIADAAKNLDVMIESRLFGRVIEVGDRILASSDFEPAELAPVHRALARARYGWATASANRTAGLGRQIISHYEHALAFNERLDGNDLARMGYAHEWQGKLPEARKDFARALAADPRVDGASDLRRHVLTLMRYRMDAPPEEYDAGLDELFVSVEPHRLDLKLWAIQQKMTVLEDLGRVEESSTLLSRHAPAFRESDLASRFEFLEALLMYKTGHLDEAEARLRDLRGGLEPSDESYAMSGWLLGRVVMGDGDPERPQEALSFFEDVLHHYSSGPYAVATRVAQGEALSMLERFDDAVEAFETAIEGLKSLTDYDLVNRDVLRTSLSVLAETQRQRAQLASAVRFARLASSLLDLNDVERAIPLQQQFARLLTLHAEALGDVPVDSSTDFEAMIHSQVSTEASDLFSEAAEVYAALARQHMLNERFASQASWLAAELFARANKRKIAASHFERFANERPSDPLVPRALLRVGQLHQHRGDFARAIDAYRACYRRFPLTLDGARALVPLAQCYLASGSRGAEHAEQVLRIVLEESEVFTPQAPEFANALFLMGDILNRSGAHERAIASLEEALDRYPRDPRKWPARFQLADAYRKSALKLKRETQDARLKGTIERMKAESSARLVEASGMYRQLIESYESRDPSSLSAIERMYLRQARLYEADCYFENGDFVSALRLYEEAAGIFRGTATTLAAYVQIVNCHVFLGQLEPARAALARATILVDAVPAEAFASAISSRSRDDWKRYFEWLENSELF